MHKFLILSSQQFGKPSANGACANSIYKELLRQQFDTSVLCYNSEALILDNEKCVSIQYSRKNGSKSTFIGRLKVYTNELLLQTIRPRYDVDLLKRLVERAEKLVKENSIDVVIAFYFSSIFPAEQVLVATKLKRKHKNLKVILYELDSAEDGISGNSFWNKMIANSYIRLLKNLYKTVDNIFILKSHENNWMTHYSAFISKMAVVDTPVLNTANFKVDISKSSKDRDVINKTVFIYSGMLSQDYRSPSRMIDFFSLLNHQIESELWIFSKGCDDLLWRAANENNNIKLMGYVSEEELSRALAQADIMINIGNSRSNSYPSKLIHYFSYCKPVLNIELQKNDICSDYVRKYPKGYTITFGSDIERAVSDFLDFYDKSKTLEISKDEITRIYYENTPEYSVRAILNHLK